MLLRVDHLMVLMMSYSLKMINLLKIQVALVEDQEDLGDRF